MQKIQNRLISFVSGFSLQTKTGYNDMHLKSIYFGGRISLQVGANGGPIGVCGLCDHL